MQCFFFFFSQFFNWKKGISFCFPTSDESWVRGRQEKCWGRARRPEADNPAGSRKSPEHFLSSPSLQPNSVPSPAYLLQHSHWKTPFQQPTCPTHCFYQGCGLLPHQDHQDPTRASPSLILIQRATPRTHLLACLSALCKLFRGGAARCPPNCKYKIILSPLQELFLTFPSLLKTSITIYFPVSHSKTVF